MPVAASLRLGLPVRSGALLWVGALFLLINGVLRLGLAVFEADPGNFLPWRMVPILAVGAVYDLAAAAYLLAPFALLGLVCPNGARGRKTHALLASTLALVALLALLFTSVGEALFWNEFASRFNFIAVDYLIYTREVLGNIRQSYAVGPLLAGIAAVTAVLFLAIRRPLWHAAGGDGGSLRARSGVALATLVLPLASFLIVGDAPREALPSVSARELAGNGYYELFRAFRSNQLDYHAFYRTMAEQDAVAEMRDEFVEARSTSVFTGRSALEREVVAPAPAKPLNVVLVTMESLGADYLESFGGRTGLTPNLDRMAREGLQFTRVYATGLRTVRGLEALSLSVPPTPGQAVPTRKNNKGFQTLGGVLQGQGYEPLFVYGGYSYFDNMKDFFAGNGYTVVDRSSLARAEISHETIWGVADEDLFKLVIREIDARAAGGRKVLAHVMTTSNHRTYTFPAGRIDIPSGSGRDGAVKYSDWAIGDFMREAATRPWFKETLFVFVADHTSHGRGRTNLPPENYHIPLIVYAPDVLAPRTIDSVASQIDVGPTILALLNVSYTSRFFGQDILTEGHHHQRALMANYLTVGHMEDGILVELSPKRRARVSETGTGREISAEEPRALPSINETIAYYQVAATFLRGR